MIYHISVITGDIKFASTDASVYIQIKGADGQSEVHLLNNNNKAKKQFDRGQVDHFHVFISIFSIIG